MSPAREPRERLILSGCVSVTAKGMVERRGGCLVGIVGPDGVWLLPPLGTRRLTSFARLIYPRPAPPPAARSMGAAGATNGGRSRRTARPGPARSSGRRCRRIQASPKWAPKNTARSRRPPGCGGSYRPAQSPASAWVIGSLVHDALAQWYFPDSNNSFAGWAAGRAHSYGLADGGQLNDAVAETARPLRRFQASRLLADMDVAERRLHEVPYSLAIDGQAQTRVIDALYLSDGRWTIGEFKTDDIRDEHALHEMLAR